MKHMKQNMQRSKCKKSKKCRRYKCLRKVQPWMPGCLLPLLFSSSHLHIFTSRSNIKTSNSSLLYALHPALFCLHIIQQFNNILKHEADKASGT